MDGSGAAAASASVTLAADHLPAMEARCDAAGRFRFEVRGSAGTPYTLTVRASGFAPSVSSGSLGDPPTWTIRLEIAQHAEQVTVDASEGARPDPAQTEAGSVLEARELAAMPLNERSLTDLLATAPGVVPVSSAQPNAVVMSGVASTPPSGDLDIGALSVSGQRETANSFRVNGSNVQEDENMGMAIVPSLDSVAKLEVLTGSFDARLGNGSGGQVLVETRSGGDRPHGSAYEYFRNTALDARNYFSLTRSPLHQNQFGGTLGGPVPRARRLFFFADYQGTRQAEGIDTGEIAVPSLADRAGNLLDQASALTGKVSGDALARALSAKLGRAVTRGEPYYTPACSPCVFPGGSIPAGAVSAPARQLLRYIPVPNVNDTTFSTSSYAQQLRDDKGSVRLDRTLPAGNLAVYGFVDDYFLLNPYPTGEGGATVPGFNAENDGRAQLYALNFTTVLGSRGTHAAHASFMRNAAIAGRPRGGTGISLLLQGFVTGAGTSGIVPLLPGQEGVANVIFNSFTMGVDVTSLSQAENTSELTDDVSLAFGKHLFSFGASAHWDQINTHPDVYGNGSFSFTGSETGSDFADFLIGVDSSYTQGQGENFYNRNHYVGLYAQDSWRARPTLTLNYGLRWDLLPPWSEKYNQLLTLDPAEQSIVFPGAPKGILFPGDPGVADTLAPARYANFAPRAALSWSPVATGTTRWLLGRPGATVIRAGYGLYYSAIEGLSAGVMSGNPPYGFTDTSAAPTLFDQPFVAAATGVSVGQRFPLQPVAFGASRAHPNNSVDWSGFEPLTGIPAYSNKNVTPYAENYTVSIERELAARTALTVSYVGTEAHHLLVDQEANPGDPALCLSLSTAASVTPGSATCGPFGESGSFMTAAGRAVQGTRSAFGPAFGSVNLQRTLANAHDNALELSLRRSTRSLFVQFSYTWSRSIDQSSSLAEAVYPDAVPGGAGRSRALSAFDLTHNAVALYRYDLPLEKLSTKYPRLTGGWEISGLTRWSTGFPVTLFNNNDTSLLGTQPNGINNNGIDEPQFAGGDLKLHRRPGAPAFQTGLFTVPALGTLGDARRRFFYGPGAEDTRIALSKTTALHGDGAGTATLELRLESLNVFNHGQFFGPAAVNGNIASGNFGAVQNAAPARLLQLAARVRF